MRLTQESPTWIGKSVPTPVRGRFRRFPPEAELAAPLLGMLEELGARDGGLREHCESVGRLAAGIGRRLGLGEQAVARLRLAGVLHDIGKVVVPGRILHKPGPLDDGEWEQIRRHPQTGWLVIRSVGLEEIADWVLCHHERPDGSGYPHGPRRRHLPLGAAILAAADAYHAMTEERPYQLTLGHAEAREELRRCSGTQFDPAVVEALLDLSFTGLDTSTT